MKKSLKSAHELEEEDRVAQSAVSRQSRANLKGTLKLSF